MLSKEDYNNYLAQMKQLEIKMVIVYKDCADRVKDEHIKEVCSGISSQERKHVSIVEELEKLFNI
ncbi:MAG: hypothetical protein JSV30_00030 [Candidatus Omnitrophota bacterium]|nr:MAG: hypothetical protein JSV30_00030 [Candidatus Omnitrophota bacterium]